MSVDQPLEGTDCSNSSLETHDSDSMGVKDGLSGNRDGVSSSPNPSLSRHAVKISDGIETGAAADGWWTSHTALSVYFVACVAIFSTQTWILRALMVFIIYKMTCVVGKWLMFFWSSADLADLIRITKIYTGILKREGERTLEGGNNRRMMEGAALYGAKVGKPHVFAFVEGKLDELNKGVVEELRHRHGESSDK